MALKIFRVMWFLSVLVLFASLLYAYAGWGESLVLQEQEGSQVTMGKDPLFYLLVAIIGVINVFVYIIGKVYRSQEDFRAWFHGLLITINIFFIIAISLLSVFNGDGTYNYSKIGFMIYGSVGLIALWALGWPLYLLANKFFLKSAVEN